MSAVRATALFTFIRPAPPLRGISGEYITIKKLRPQIKKKKGEFHSLHGQQRPFHLPSPLIAAYPAIRPYRPLTRNGDREWSRGYN